MNGQKNLKMKITIKSITMEQKRTGAWANGFAMGFETRDKQAVAERKARIDELMHLQKMVNDLDARNRLLEEETQDYHLMEADLQMTKDQLRELNAFVGDGPSEIQRLKEEILMSEQEHQADIHQMEIRIKDMEQEHRKEIFSYSSQIAIMKQEEEDVIFLERAMDPVHPMTLAKQNALLRKKIENMQKNEAADNSEFDSMQERHQDEIRKLVEDNAADMQQIREDAKAEIDEVKENAKLEMAALHVYYTERLRRRDKKIQEALTEYDNLYSRLCANRPLKRPPSPIQDDTSDEVEILGTTVNLKTVFDEVPVIVSAIALQEAKDSAAEFHGYNTEERKKKMKKELQQITTP